VIRLCLVCHQKWELELWLDVLLDVLNMVLPRGA